MCIANYDIKWTDKFKYLGIIIKSDKKFCIDFSETKHKFVLTDNNILYHCRMCSEFVKLELLEKHCLPILLYTVEVLDLPYGFQKEINSLWNFVYRKIFSF